MSSWWYCLLFASAGGVMTALLVARLLNRSPRQDVQPPALQKVEVVIHSPVSPVCPCWCPFCDASAEDLEHSQQIADLARRLQSLYDANDEPREPSVSLDYRRLEFARHLVQTKRLSDDL